MSEAENVPNESEQVENAGHADLELPEVPTQDIKDNVESVASNVDGAVDVKQTDIADKRQSQADSAKGLDTVELDSEHAPASEVKEEPAQPESEKTADNGESNSQDGSKIDEGEGLKLQTEMPVLSPGAEASSENASSPPAKRKLFGWLSRTASSNEKTMRAPPPLPLRVNPTPNMTITEEQSGPLSPTNKRSSLQDRFKLVRMREEAGIDVEGEGLAPRDFLGRSQSVDVLKTLQQQEANGTKIERAQTVADPSDPTSTLPGPTDTQGEKADPVDWDLWQEVVYEGPTAVSRRSSKELNDAVARGIPSVIRGVVWQVLAQSKDESLEATYRDLKARQGGEEIPPTSRRYKPRLPPRQNSTIGKPDSRRTSLQSTTLEQPETIISAESATHGTNAESAVVNAAGDTNGAPLQHATSRTSEPASYEDAKTLDKLTISKLEKTIKRDMGSRTSYSKFLMSAGLQDGLFGICKAYALYDEDVGYAQGMNFIAMPLLFNMPEEEAFCLFVRLMNQYKLRNQFIRDMPGLHLHLYQFERLLEDLEPAVYCHLHRRGVSPQLYATQWFLTLFAYRFPLQLVLRIYDLILCEGLENAILKFGIALMQKNAQQLLIMKDMVELTTFLKERLFDVYIDKSPSANSVLESGFFGSAGGADKEVYKADALVQDACAIRVTPDMLSTYTKEWEQKVQDEKEKEAADEALRTSNATLTARVKSLEERAETSDREHVESASELVRIKVINHQLADENESLKMQVAQLKTIVDAQPGEVEDRLRAEMDRIMSRNIEVQNENRALEEENARMGSELADAKAQWATIDLELTAMKQKWTSITGIMNGK